MSVIDKLKDWFFDEKDNDPDDGNDEYEELENPKKTKPSSKPKKTVYDDYSSLDEEENKSETYVPPTPPPPPPQTNNDTPLRTNTNNNDGRGRSRTPNNTNLGKIKVDAVLEVVLVRPEVYTDAKQVADHLMNGKTVVINLENSTPETKRRILDFLTGVAYANKGAIKSVASLTYIITPHNVGFTGDDLVGELENNGVML